MTRAIAAAVLAATLMHGGTAVAQQSDDDKAVMQHRLTIDLIRKILAVDRDLVAVLKKDPAFLKRFSQPATGLEASAAQMNNTPEVANALKAHRITAREYLLTQLALFSTALTHEFMASGKLKELPPNTPTHNIEFWKANVETLKPLEAEWRKIRAEIMGYTK